MEFSPPDVRYWALLAPLLVTLTGVVVLLRGVFGAGGEDEPRRWSLGGLAAAAAAALLVSVMGDSDSFAGMLRLDSVTVFFWLVMLAATAGALLAADERLRPEGVKRAESLALLLFACLGMMLMAAGGHLLLIFLGLETMSLALYILAGLNGQRDPRSNEAALKYLLLGAFATGFLVYGMAFVYGGCGSLQVHDTVVAVGFGNADGAFLSVGLGLLTVGLGFKVALVPFHMWAPDVYEGAPTPVTAFMAVGPKVAGFAAMVRVFIDAAGGLAESWAPLLALLALLTMLLGNLMALAQSNLKRLLAYSSIAHAGYLAVGIVAGALGVQAVLYYGLAYAAMTLGAFAVVMIVAGDGERLALDNYAGLAKRSPLAAGAMTLFLLALASIPPTSGFLGKWLLFVAAVQAGYTWLAVLGVLCSLIGIFYYLRIVVRMYFDEPANAEPVAISEPSRQLVWAAGIATALLSLPTGLFFVWLAGRAVG